MARNVVIFICLGIGIAALFLINIFYGAVSIPFSSVVDALLGCQLPEASWQFIILQSRLPQALTALFAGCALSVCGLMLQAVFRNPLADPSILGISSGAGLGVALVMLLWGGGFAVGSLAVGGFVAVLVSAFIGAFTVTLIMYLLSLVIRSNTMLLIVGVLVGYVSSSFIVLLNFFASQDGVRAYMMWGMGSFSGVPHAMLPVFMITIILCLIVPILLAKPLNLLVLGNKYAENLGVGIRTVRNALLLASGTLTAIVTTFCGPIAFIGLAVPHMARLVFKTDDFRILIPAVMLCGAATALVCNAACVLPGDGGVIPLNVVTPLIGVPLILYIMLKKYF